VVAASLPFGDDDGAGPFAFGVLEQRTAKNAIPVAKAASESQAQNAILPLELAEEICRGGHLRWLSQDSLAVGFFTHIRARPYSSETEMDPVANFACCPVVMAWDAESGP
jgi:hypothetical protein